MATSLQRRPDGARQPASRAPQLRLSGKHSGAVALHSLDDVLDLAKTFAASGVFQDVREAPQAVAKILYGAEMGFSPIASMQGVYLVKGKLALSAGLVAAAIRRHPRYDFRVTEHTDEVCRITFYGETGEELGESAFTARDAKRAGTQNMGRFPKNMLYARALTNGARWHCPDVFGGPVYVPEELGQEVDGDGTPVGLAPADVAREEPEASGSVSGDVTDAEIVEEASGDASREASGDASVAAGIAEADEAAFVLGERLALVSTADEATLNAWYAEARDGWPEPERSRLIDEIRAEAARRSA